jgi:dephospho-CoA kinase
MSGRKNMRRIGLTGSIASGKSCVSQFFARKGVAVIDADILSRKVVEVGSEGLRAITEHFGQDILLADGQLNRRALGAIVFQDEAKRRWLNALLHPMIAAMAEEQMREREIAGDGIAIFDAALLFESGWERMVDETVLICCEDELRLRRLMQRDQLSESEARDRMNSQMPQEEKRQRADVVIDNSGAWEQTKRELETLLSRWRREK